MALLADYAITPDVFDVASYSNASECRACLEVLRGAMLDDGLVRNLRDGEWRALFKSRSRAWHKRGVELINKLARQGRLVPFAPALEKAPADDVDWCAEALAAHRVRPLSGGVIVTEAVKRNCREERLVARIDRLSGASWWAERSPSVRLSPAPRIEIHRRDKGSGPWGTLPNREEARDFELGFRARLGGVLRAAGLSAEVFIWDDFHDRYLISNLVGISLPYGFDTTTAPDSVTTWTRLGRKDRDDVRREFSAARKRHKLVHRFRIP